MTRHPSDQFAGSAITAVDDSHVRPWDREFLAACLSVAMLSATALIWTLLRGDTLLYGDAEAHLNIARRIVDSRTPGLRQVGTVWLPLPHLLMLPLVRFDWFWRSGLAGAIPSAIGFVTAAGFLFSASRRLYGGSAAAFTTLALFALNPNLLYFQATPMTEPMFFAALGGLFYCAVRFQEAPSLRFAAGGGAAALVATLIRYESWFLLPFAAAFYVWAGPRRRVVAGFVFMAIAALGPLSWLVHNWRWWGDCLEFLRGTYSSRALHESALAAGAAPYPGDHDWVAAGRYYLTAVSLCSGHPALAAGVVGIVVSLRRRRALPLLLLLPTPLFYIWTIHSAGIRVLVPQLWPFAAYNTRYGLAALPLLALAGGGLVSFLHPGRRRAVVAGAMLLALLLCLENQPCRTEARDTSEARRGWTHDAAAFLRGHYRSGDGILTSFGDLTGVLREAGIPLRDALTQDNGALFQRALVTPSVLPRGTWALTMAGDDVDRALWLDSSYERLNSVSRKGASTIRIYRRGPAAGGKPVSLTALSVVDW